MAEEIVACLPPTAELAVVPRAGHDVFRDQPEEFATVIRNWVFHTTAGDAVLAKGRTARLAPELPTV
jgi:hypothetical protein